MAEIGQGSSGSQIPMGLDGTFIAEGVVNQQPEGVVSGQPQKPLAAHDTQEASGAANQSSKLDIHLPKINLPQHVTLESERTKALASAVESRLGGNPCFNTSYASALFLMIQEIVKTEKEIAKIEGDQFVKGLDLSMKLALQLSDNIKAKAEKQMEQLYAQAGACALGLGVSIAGAGSGKPGLAMAGTSVGQMADHIVQAAYVRGVASYDADNELIRAAKENVNSIMNSNQEKMKEAHSVIDALLQSYKSWVDEVGRAFAAKPT